MLLEIKSVRPPLLSENSYGALNELRRFRHVFRHAYSYGLDDERVAYLLRKIIKTQPGIMKDLAKFRSVIIGLTPPENHWTRFVPMLLLQNKTAPLIIPEMQKRLTDSVEKEIWQVVEHTGRPAVWNMIPTSIIAVPFGCGDTIIPEPGRISWPFAPGIGIVCSGISLMGKCGWMMPGIWLAGGIRNWKTNFPISNVMNSFACPIMSIL